MYLIRRSPLGYKFCQVVHNLNGSPRIDYPSPLDDTTDLNETLEREEANYRAAFAAIECCTRGAAGTPTPGTGRRWPSVRPGSGSKSWSG